MAKETGILSEEAANVVENLACRVAEKCAGTVTPGQLAPYLPMSLGLIRSCLDDMVDGTSVVSEVRDNIIHYEFAAYRGLPAQDGMLDAPYCLGCEKDLADSGDVLCGSCSEALLKELGVLAEKMGWPAQAVYEHEILYHAESHDGPVHAEALASSSRYTLGRMRKKLDILTVENFARQELDRDAGLMTYRFPPLEYPRDLYRRNMNVILSHPASMTEETQIKMVRILFSLGFIVLAMFILAFFGIPFPFLTALFCIAGPITAFVIWRHRSRLAVD